MAISKKEQERIDKKMMELRIRGAMFIGEPVAPDILPPKSSCYKDPSTWSFGFDMNSYCKEVRFGLSTSASHTTCYIAKDGSETPIGKLMTVSGMSMAQGSRSYFSTRLKALKAMRYEVARKYARELAEIDLMIEQEEANPCPLSQYVRDRGGMTENEVSDADNATA